MGSHVADNDACLVVSNQFSFESLHAVLHFRGSFVSAGG
jgi:hypothetical protein